MNRTNSIANSQREDPSLVMAHEAEIIIPGSFVVLQGNAGDGLRNTIDTIPTLVDDEDEEEQVEDNHHQDDINDDDDDDDEYHVMDLAPSQEEFQHVENLRCEERHEQHQQHQTNPFHHTNRHNRYQQEHQEEAQPKPRIHPLPLGHLASSQPTATAAVTLNRFSSSVASRPVAATTLSQTSSGRDDAYIVVTEDETPSDQPPSTVQQAQKSSTARTQSSMATTSTDTSTSRPRRSPRTTKASAPTIAATATNRATAHQMAIEKWNQECRSLELRQRRELRQSQQLPVDEDVWWQSEGRICLFRDIPARLKNGVLLKSVLGTLSPGSTIVATDIVYLDSQTFARIAVAPTTSTSGTSPHKIYPRGRQGWIQLIKVEEYSGRPSSFAVLSVDGYPFLTPGLPSLYVDPHVWIWRVTCPAGAFVREGLDLNTQHIDTFPYGSLIRVTRKTVNNMGLSRLRVQGIIDYDGLNKRQSPRIIDGWCSEFLNPLSGQRGMVAQPVPFPVPALYRVTLPLGAVIRSNVELSSSQIGIAPMGAILVIVGRAFSEHPMDKCIERLKLAGNGGWISVRLNRPPPQDDVVVELMGIDGTFEPDSPGMFHLDAQRKVQASEMEPTFEGGEGLERRMYGGEISSIDDSNSSTSSNGRGGKVAATVRRKATPPTTLRHGPEHYAGDKCLICLTEDRNATIVHGETGHVACCLVCARILKARGDKVRVVPWRDILSFVSVSLKRTDGRS